MRKLQNLLFPDNNILFHRTGMNSLARWLNNRNAGSHEEN
jgi:hypothetical protein